MSHDVMAAALHSPGDPQESSQGRVQAAGSLPLIIPRKELAWKEELLFRLVLKVLDQPRHLLTA